MTKAILNWNGKVEISNDKTLRIRNLISLSQVNWNPPAIYKSYCGIDVEFFPFDEQVHFDFDQSNPSPYEMMYQQLLIF